MPDSYLASYENDRVHHGRLTRGASSRRTPKRACVHAGLTGYKPAMLWLLLVIALIAVFGLGSVLEAAFWTLLVIAAVVVIVVLAIGRVLGR